MKKMLLLSLLMLLLMSISAIPVFAAGHIGHSHGHELERKQKIPGQVIPYVGEAVFENLNPSFRIAEVVVNVTSPVDDEWQAEYTNYNFEANRAVERADDALLNEFGINFLSVAQPIWSSSSTDYDDLLDEAMDEHGLTYNGSLTADVMIAFSGVDTGSTTGAAYRGTPYSTIFDNGYSTNAETTQHEAGHMYGLRHDQEESDPDYDGSNCVMTATGFGFIDQFCDGHHDDWSAAASMY